MICDKEPSFDQKLSTVGRNDTYHCFKSNLMSQHIDYIKTLDKIQKNEDEVSQMINHYKLLEDNNMLSHELKILLAPRSTLKKCRFCNFKKRLCALNRSECSAFYRSCNSCKKKGHFPKSLNCTKTRKNHNTVVKGGPYTCW